ncbi:MAG: class I SAM-dependent methyltransferase [Bacteroidetes bacterium]|nr:class I SAM-dependent methyltransferase [Bacteroidota bacterium]
MFELLGKQLRKPSGFWGKLVAKMMDRRNKKFYLEIIRMLNLETGDKVFEIGYGSGLGISLLANTDIACTIQGIDFSELMYKKASKRNKIYIEHCLVNLSYGDLLTTDFKRERFNKIFCVNVIYFWDDLSVVFEKIMSMMNHGGMFCIFMTHEKEFKQQKFAHDFCKYTIENVELELKNAGFSKINHTFDNGYFITAIK